MRGNSGDPLALLYEAAIGLPFSPLKEGRSMAYNATNGGSQTAEWESDTVIVPWILGNARVGKEGTYEDPFQGTHSLHSGVVEKMATELNRIRVYELATTLNLLTKSRVR